MKTVFVVGVCGIGLTVSTLAQDEARIFQYSPIAQLVGEGQYRAEVWRRENASGKEERAWSSSDLHGSSDEAMAAACAVLRENFAFSCTQTMRDAKTGETVKAPGTVVTTESSPPKVKGPRGSAVNSPAPAPKAVGAASKLGSNNWVTEFWENQLRLNSGGGSQ